MKRKVLFVVFFVFVWCAITFAQIPPTPLYSIEWPPNCGLLSDWTILKGDWGCSPDGVECHSPKGTIIATPAFAAGCDSCTVVNGFFLTSGQISFLAWYEDPDNFVKLRGRRKNNDLVKWTLVQVVNGQIVAKESGEQLALGDFHERAAVGFDGQTFSVVINETPTPLFTMEKEPGSAPFGTVGYQHKRGNAGFEATIVYPGIFFPTIRQ